jgi:glycosyltransferase involved in cell wall biosynthesis
MTDVSVVIAAKNESLHVEEAVLSVADQTGVDFELVFVDDGSTDETFAIVQKLAATRPHIRLMRNPKQGKCSAFNFGVTQAKGRFVTIFAGDDIMPPGSLAARYETVRTGPDDTPVVGLCKLQMLSDNPREDGTVVPKGKGRGVLSGVSYLFNRAALAKAFPVPEQFPNEDTFLELAVLHLGWQQVHSDVIGCRWRIHSGNSINLRSSFEDFNRKITQRMRVIWVFWDQFQSEMSPQDRALVQTKMQLEESRARGSVIGVLTARIHLRDRLRALAYTNSVFYGIRQRLYGLLSGL